MRSRWWLLPVFALATVQGCLCADTVTGTRFACRAQEDCLAGSVCRGGECRPDDIPPGVCFAGEVQACTPSTCQRACGADAGWQACAPIVGPGFDANPLHCGECGRACGTRLAALTCLDGRCTCLEDADCPAGEACGPGGVCLLEADPCAAVACDAGTVCRAGTCAETACATGCARGEVCDDGTQRCRPVATCRLTVPCGDGGTCEGDAKPDGEPCDDGDGCTSGDQCLAGFCTGQPATSYLDGDGDGVGNTAVPTATCPPPSGYVPDAGDCDDANALVMTPLPAARDADQDGVTATTTLDPGACVGLPTVVDGRTYFRDDGGGATWLGAASAAVDCDDADAGVFEARAALLTDADQDGYGHSPEAACVGRPVTAGGRAYFANAAGAFVLLDPAMALGTADCDDTNAVVFLTRDVARDADHDGATVTTALAPACTGAATVDGARTYFSDAMSGATWLGAASATADCDDSSATIIGPASYYADGDGDGVGAGAPTLRCGPQAGEVLVGTDCNDSSALVSVTRTVARDADHDGFTVATTTATRCTGAPQDGGVLVDGGVQAFYQDALGAFAWVDAASTAADCDDDNAAIYPAVFYRDADGDGRGLATDAQAQCPQQTGWVADATDCNDTNQFEYQLLSTATDADHDGYATGAAAMTCVGASTMHNGRTYYFDSPNGFVQVLGSQLLGTSDCNPTNGDLVASVNNVLQDDDQDGYPFPDDTAQSIACAGPATVASGRTYYADGAGGWWLARADCIGRTGNNCPNLDCYDANASAFPGQVTYFAVQRGDGSFDYDCSGTVTSGTTGGQYCSTITNTVPTYTDGTCGVATGATATTCNSPATLALPAACGRRQPSGTSAWIISGTCGLAATAGATTIRCR